MDLSRIDGRLRTVREMRQTTLARDKLLEVRSILEDSQAVLLTATEHPSAYNISFEEIISSLEEVNILLTEVERELLAVPDTSHDEKLARMLANSSNPTEPTKKQKQEQAQKEQAPKEQEKAPKEKAQKEHEDKTEEIIIDLVKPEARQEIEHKLVIYSGLLNRLTSWSSKTDIQTLPVQDIEQRLISLAYSDSFTVKPLKRQFLQNPQLEMVIIIYLHYAHSRKIQAFEQWMVDALLRIHTYDLQLISFYAVMWAGSTSPQRLYNLLADRSDIGLLSDFTEEFYQRALQ